jgi:hypothetical protein
LDWVVKTKIINSTGEEFTQYVDGFKEHFLSYQLFPYFGGNQKAPNDILISLFIGGNS